MIPLAAAVIAIPLAALPIGAAGAQTREPQAWSPVETIRRAPGGAVRDVTGGRLIRIAPDTRGGSLQRLPSRAPVSVAPPRPERPERFHRVVFEDAGHFRVGGREIALAGLVAPAIDAACPGDGAAGPCGRRAAAAIRRFVRARSLDCAPLADDAAQNGDAARLCHVGPVLLNAWIVAQGWAAPSDDAVGRAFLPLRDEAREAGRGLHARADNARIEAVVRAPLQAPPDR